MDLPSTIVGCVWNASEDSGSQSSYRGARRGVPLGRQVDGSRSDQLLPRFADRFRVVITDDETNGQ